MKILGALFFGIINSGLAWAVDTNVTGRIPLLNTHNLPSYREPDSQLHPSQPDRGGTTCPLQLRGSGGEREDREEETRGTQSRLCLRQGYYLVFRL